MLALLAAFVVAGAITAGPGTSAAKDGRQLYGFFGPGLTIHIVEDGPGGAPVTSLQPGTYWLTVHDNSMFHNFHIIGPGVDQVVTTTPFIGDVTVKLLLEHGDYTYQCDPHKLLGMIGTFEVGGVGQVD